MKVYYFVSSSLISKFFIYIISIQCETGTYRNRASVQIQVFLYMWQYRLVFHTVGFVGTHQVLSTLYYFLSVVLDFINALLVDWHSILDTLILSECHIDCLCNGTYLWQHVNKGKTQKIQYHRLHSPHFTAQGSAKPTLEFLMISLPLRGAFENIVSLWCI